MKIKRGDRVQVITGKERGKQGEVIRALPSAGKVIVDGVNRAKRHQKATRQTMQGGIIDKEVPIPVENVAIVCHTDGPTRIGYRIDDQGRKVRICRKCGGDV